MAIRTIRTVGDRALTKVCRPVEEVTPKIKELIIDMLDTMYEACGGLAAPGWNPEASRGYRCNWGRSGIF